MSLKKAFSEVLLGDKVKIYQILVNLIGNSLKFTEKGFLKLSVKRANNNDNDKLNNYNIKGNIIKVNLKIFCFLLKIRVMEFPRNK
jgi:signal transduction histidine kinase